MKKLIAMLLVLAMALSLVACGGTAEKPAEEKPADTPAAPEVSNEPAAEPAPEMEDSLVIYATHTDEEMEAFTAYFREQYPDVEIEIVNGTFGELMARVQAESAAPVADLVIGGLNSATGQEYLGYFQEYVSSHDGELLVPSSNNLFNCVLVSILHLSVNTKLEQELGLNITGYQDLLDPALYGKIIMADPNSSSSAWNNLMNMMMVFGIDSDEAWAYIEALMRNGLVVVSSSSSTYKSVYQGEYVCGLTYESGAATIVEAGGEDFEIRYFDEGSIAVDSGMAMVKDCTHPVAAKAFIECLTSAEGQTLGSEYNASIRFSNKNFVNNNPNAFLPANSELKFNDWDVDTLVAKKAEILDHWNTLYAEINGQK